MFRGISPRVTNSTQQGNSNVAPLGEASQIPRDRMVLREAWGAVSQKVRYSQTPFRVAMHAGDLFLRQREPGGSNQIKGSVGIGGYRNTLGGGDGVSKGTGASGNQHFVYDSSDYVRFKKLSAKVKNYDDYSFGGSNNGAYVSLLAVRRF